MTVLADFVAAHQAILGLIVLAAMFAAFLVGVMLRTTYDDRAGGTS